MPAKLTQEKFICRAKDKHNDYYDYSLAEYINATTKVKITCPKHGIFEQQPNNHLHGQGCIKCMGDRVRDSRKLSHNEFITKLEKINPEIFTLIKFKSEYVNNKTKLLLESKYGDVGITPNMLYKGVKPCISNAVDPINYLLNFIKINNPSIFFKIINISDEYKGVMKKIKINTIYGEVSLPPDSLLRGGGFDLRSATNPLNYLYNYINYHQPQYTNPPIEFTSEFKGVNNPIEFKILGKKYISTPTALMSGYFSTTPSLGIFNLKNIEKNKLEFINKKCILYKIKLFNENEVFYKVGITTTPISNRFRQIPYNIEIIELIDTNLYDGYNQEKQIHKQLSKSKYSPQIQFGGKTECFTNL